MTFHAGLARHNTAALITQAKHLDAFLIKLRASPWVAMDTEADSLHAYPEKVCLIQISLPGQDRLVDPLTRLDLKPLWAALDGRELIMHGSDYDLRLLRRTYQFVPAMIFDTMLAARLLGYHAFGLGALVERHLHVHHEKGPQKANWAQRPLSPRMEIYARNDSRYLKPLEEILRRELQAKGRLEWHREMCQRLIAQCAVEPEPDPDSLWRVKGSGRLGRRALGVLRALWRWREKEALSANRPPFFILSAEHLVGVATAAADGKDFDHLLPHRFSPRRRAELADAVAKALALPPERLPHPAPREASPRLNAAHRKALEELTHRRDARAAELKIDPTLIASRATLLALVTQREAARKSLMRWQEQLLF